MTDDPQDPEGDEAALMSDAERRAAGRVYLVRDRPPSDERPRGGSGDTLGDGPDRGLDTDDSAAIPPATHAADDLPDNAADGDDGPVQREGRTPAGEDWPWVVEWRAGGEPTPWTTGLALSAFAALVVGVAVWVLSAGLADRPIVAVLVNLLVAGGLAPAMWLSKDLPVLRWLALGALIGIVGGWIAALMMLPMPTV